MKKFPCERCGTKHRPSRHHIYPKHHFGKSDNICWLCTDCHRDIEDIIMKEEIKASNGLKTRRFKLPAERYLEILLEFLQPIEYTFNLEGKLLCTVSLQCLSGTQSGFTSALT